MSVPSGRPVTAQEAIAETLRAACLTGLRCDQWGNWRYNPTRGAAAVVEAVRALPAEQVAELLGMTEEFKDAEDGAGGAWQSADGKRHGGSTTLPTRSRRYVTAWEVVRPRSTTAWQSAAWLPEPAVQGQAHTERSE